MRHKIVDHTRRKRPDELKSKDLSGLEANGDESAQRELERAEFYVALDAAVEKLRADDPVAAEVFVVRFFGGCRLALEHSVKDLGAVPTAGEKLTLAETGRILEMPVATVDFKWKKAQMFLARELKDSRPER